MKPIRIIGIFLALGLCAGWCCAQTTPQPSSATVTITVTAAPVAANVSIVPNSATVQAGSTANLTVTVTGNATSGVPTGTVELLAKAPGQTTYTELSTFPLTNGKAACSYPIPASAPIGTYSVEAVYLAPQNGPYY